MVSGKFRNPYSKKNQLKRLVWTICWNILARPFPRNLGRKWKLFLLRIFGAKVASTSVVYSKAKIFMPWNLEMDDFACIASDVDCYNAAKVRIGKNATVSQYSYICTATHDITSKSHTLYALPITIEDNAWVASKAYIGPGVVIGEGAVVGATASVYKNVNPWEVVGGNPAKFIKKREIKC
ncbi:MAG: putative colanic acid biosynthesis acetyltransferase [Candidatus Azobacteroides sp.]|nr:putative colanic acid biosynthesis acetyltransferase [Candidatus Azobacteroides sp.]